MEVWIPIVFFAMIAAIVIVPSYLKSQERREMQATLRSAIDKGQPVPQEMIDAMTKPVKAQATAVSDIRTGVIWVAVGVGLGLFGFMVSYENADAHYPLMGIAGIPVIIGLAFIVLSFFNPNKGK
ncbi:MAG: hypothetical protein KF842_10020 [Caulobacter sp.]|nr:hypothetical protein [Caulobacter sp.]